MRFKVAFSFPGQAREEVEKIVLSLQKITGWTKKELLYDKFYEAEFAVRNLDKKLRNLYENESELITTTM